MAKKSGTSSSLFICLWRMNWTLLWVFVPYFFWWYSRFHLDRNRSFTWLSLHHYCQSLGRGLYCPWVIGVHITFLFHTLTESTCVWLFNVQWSRMLSQSHKFFTFLWCLLTSTYLITYLLTHWIALWTIHSVYFSLICLMVHCILICFTFP